MEDFTKLSIDIAFSSRLKNYDKLVTEGDRKMKSCIFYDDRTCIKFRANSRILTVWKKDNKLTPHPLFCYLCPFYAFRDDGERITFSMYDLYLFYVELRSRLDKELTRLDERLNDVAFSSSFFIRRRYSEMMEALSDVEDKIDVIKTILSVTKDL